MERIKLFEEFVNEAVADSFVITNHDKNKFVTFKFDASNKENKPGWTDNPELAYTYPTIKDAEKMEDFILADFLEKELTYIVSFKDLKK